MLTGLARHLATLIVALAAAVRVPAPAPAPSQKFAAATCFPFETLAPAERARAEELLLDALDGEALYTIASDIKPASSGVLMISVPVAAPALEQADTVRRILTTWTCGDEISATLHHFARIYEGQRTLDVMVFNRPAMRTLLAQRRAFFGPYGLSPNADPVEALLAIEYDPTPARNRGYGLLFGYPDYAVDFFVDAAESELATKQFVERDFISLPTVKGERRFVYAVPKGHVENGADRELRARATVVFRDYQDRRRRHITSGSASGVLALVREWFDDGAGDVRPSNAYKRFKR